MQEYAVEALFIAKKVVEREALRGIATSRDWGRVINVSEAPAGGGRRQWGRVAESILGGTSCIISK
jgi:hypothetical protein